MSNDSRFVLAQLTRTAIWSKWHNLLQHKRLVVDAESVITHLCRHCVNQHISRQRDLLERQKLPATMLDYNSATLINYQELAQFIELLLDFFGQHDMELAIVYRGKNMEAPLFGIGATQYKKNVQRTTESLLAMLQYESSLAALNGGATGSSQPVQEHKVTLDRMRPTRPNLALTLFKTLVNQRMAAAAKPAIQTHQAFYCSYPTCAKLARDLKCPVMTNDGDFIVMDVREGFIMFEEFFASQLMHSEAMSRYSSAGSQSPAPVFQSTTSVSSMARNQLPPGPRNSPRPGLSAVGSGKSLARARLQRSPSASSDRHQSGRRSPRSLPKQILVRFHRHRAFLRQHPGLNHVLALQLFPLTSGEFLTQYARSLVRLRIYPREFREKDLIVATADQKSFKKYHMAAARLELVMRFLCAKDDNVVPLLVRGESSRLNCAIQQDYQGLYNYYAVSYHFKGRLKLVLSHKTALDIDQANFIEHCLLERECTADFWLSLLCCALGQLSAVDYNKTMRFEDLQTKHSARAMLDWPKCLMMSLLGGDNKLHKSARSPDLTSDQVGQLKARFPTASLTVIDRQGRKMVERSVSGVVGGSRHQTLSQQQLATFEQVRGQVSLNQLVRQALDTRTGQQPKRSPKSEAVALMNLAFNAPADMTKLASLDRPHGMAQWPPHLLTQSDHSRVARQLALMLSLHRHSIIQAGRDDAYFKQNYLAMGQHLEVALVNMQLFHIYSELPQSHTSGRSSQPGTSASTIACVDAPCRKLFKWIYRLDMETLTNYKGLVAAVQAARDKQANVSSAQKANTSLSSVKSTEKRKLADGSSGKVAPECSLASSTTKLIRHLIELLEGSLEAYCELNAFLNYPLPQLQLQNYNPVLLFNLTLATCMMSGDMAPGEARRSKSKQSAPSRKTN